MLSILDLQGLFRDLILPQLYPPEISTVYAVCGVWREMIDGDWEWLYRSCRHVEPHSFDDVPIVNNYGVQQWYREGKLHRDGDLPAVMHTGCSHWHKDGKLHRDGDFPAVIETNGTQFWYKDGKLHRDGDLPAVIYADGLQFWFKDGENYEL